MKISVALCTYNGEKYLADQLQSILDQTMPVHEIVICDDCSVDKTIAIINNFATAHQDVIRLYVNEKNLGGKKNFERALSLTTGDIIFFCDQDDTWEINKVEAMVKVLRAEPGCSGVFSDAFLIDEKGRRFNYSFLDSLTLDSKDRMNLKKEEICGYILNYGNIVAGSMLAIRKECKEQVLPLKLLDLTWHDEWIALVLSSVNKLAFINAKLINYRQHGEQQLGAGSDKFKSLIQGYKSVNDVRKQRKDYLIYFNHSWEAYHKVKAYAKELPALNSFIVPFKERALQARNNLLQQQNFVMRKVKLSKWFIKGEFETDLKDLIKL